VKKTTSSAITHATISAGTGISLIAYTLQEVRRFFIYFELAIQKTVIHLLDWSLWRRKHQAIAHLYHDKKNARYVCI
jgi:hypothetical protein